MSNDNGDFGSFLAGFVLGGLVGAAAALILAPQSGVETRNQLLEKGNTFRSQADTYRSEYQSRAQAYLHEASQQVGGSVGETTQPHNIVLDDGLPHDADGTEDAR
ncbi:MAG: YtxH domain-containing protein [Anaerolineales bacterium]|nr:YtxH domain-containing protein [Anaerolineales bacterium]